MTLKTAKRGAVPPFIVMDVLRAANERAAQGDDVLHLEVGQPGTGAPAGVVAAAKAALDNDRLAYTDALGVEPLRRRIARHYQDKYGAGVDWRQVAVTPGSSGAFILAFLAAFEAGDRVALASPGYPAYRNILAALGVEVVEVAVGPETNFQPTPAVLERVEGELDGLIVASPANPTGTMLHAVELAALADCCRERRIRFVSDEIYHGITYERPAATALAFEDDAIVVNSFSKYYAMTGWRLGWMVVPKPLLRSVECLAQNLFISPPTLSQLAAVAAFDCEVELDANVARYARNRDILLSELPKAGFAELAAAEGAFYIYANVAHRTNDSEAFCRRMLAETGVAVTPGVDFDPERGNRFIRFSFAGTAEDMAEAARRLIAWRQ
ncbi:MAG: aminotransferase class I/II-fold pyridoxal phosphate-dependent enzyme [Rhodospirillales bacterium]|nr:aminotransferase class I/II-fold pyridoxal phosphate-dependent enzyme [Rhodospirillales bacterium]